MQEFTEPTLIGSRWSGASWITCWRASRWRATMRPRRLRAVGRRLAEPDLPAVRRRGPVCGLLMGIMAAGVAAGDRVGIMSRTRYEWTLVDYALVRGSGSNKC